MADARPFGPLLIIAAEAIGQPGQRRFRIKAMNDAGESASLWLEKEQLIALGEALENVLKEEGYEYRALPLDDAGPEPVFPLDAHVEFRASQLSMGVNRDSRTIVLIGAEVTDEDAEAVSFEFDYRRGFELRRQVADVVASGRPPCPLCTAPMDPQGHVCPRTNGHHKQ
jgi:uncharacterized repeat protein (TIGR03847 family)